MNKTIIALVVLLIIALGAYMYLYSHTQNVSETHTASFVRDWDVVTIYVSHSYYDLDANRLIVNASYVRLYLADTLDKMTEGYKYKDRYDFMGKNASGILFLLYKYYNDHVCITMKDVSLNLTVFIGRLFMLTGEKQIWKPGENRYYVIYASISITHELNLKPGDEICVSLKNIPDPVMIEIDPGHADIFRKPKPYATTEIKIIDAEKIAFG